MTVDVAVTVLTERDTVVTRYRFGSVDHALSFLAAYVPPEGCYTEMTSGEADAWDAWENGLSRCPICTGLPTADFEAICDCDRLVRENGTAIPPVSFCSSETGLPGRQGCLS